MDNPFIFEAESLHHRDTKAQRFLHYVIPPPSGRGLGGGRVCASILHHTLPSPSKEGL